MNSYFSEHFFKKIFNIVQHFLGKIWERLGDFWELLGKTPSKLPAQFHKIFFCRLDRDTSAG